MKEDFRVGIGKVNGKIEGVEKDKEGFKDWYHNERKERVDVMKEIGMEKKRMKELRGDVEGEIRKLESEVKERNEVYERVNEGSNSEIVKGLKEKKDLEDEIDLNTLNQIQTLKPQKSILQKTSQLLKSLQNTHQTHLESLISTFSTLRAKNDSLLTKVQEPQLPNTETHNLLEKQAKISEEIRKLTLKNTIITKEIQEFQREIELFEEEITGIKAKLRRKNQRINEEIEAGFVMEIVEESQEEKEKKRELEILEESLSREEERIEKGQMSRFLMFMVFLMSLGAFYQL